MANITNQFNGKKTQKWFSSLLMLLLLLLFPLTLSAGPQSTTYELKEYGFGAGGIASDSSNTYTLFGVAGEQDLASASSTTYALQAGLTFSLQAGVPPAPAFNNPNSNYDRLEIILATGGNPSDTKYAIAISDDNWTTTRFVKSDYTVGNVLAATDWLPYIGGQNVGWGGASGFYVTGLKNGTTYRIRVKAQQGQLTESRWSNDASQTTADPTLTFTMNALDTSIRAYWKADETSSPSVDSTGNGNAATWHGSTTYMTGKYSNALSFNGSTDYASFPDTNLGTTNTATFWINYLGSGDGVIIGNAPGTYAAYIDGPGATNRIYYSATINNYVSVVHGGLTPGVWYHFAVVRSGTDVTFYKNGTQIGTTQTMPTNDSLIVNCLGAHCSGLPFYFQGGLDEVRLYNRALSSNEIIAVYTNGPDTASNLTFSNLNSGNSYTDASQQTTLTTSTNAYNGYIVYAYATGPLTNQADVSKTIANYGSPNSGPTAWTGTGFGYTTNDSNLTGGTADRFTSSGPNYAGFTTSAPGDPVADHAGPVTSPVTNEQFTVSYRVTASSGTTAGTYKSTVEYIVTPTY